MLISFQKPSEESQYDNKNKQIKKPKNKINRNLFGMAVELRTQVGFQ